MIECKDLKIGDVIYDICLYGYNNGLNIENYENCLKNKIIEYRVVEKKLSKNDIEIYICKNNEEELNKYYENDKKILLGSYECRCEDVFKSEEEIKIMLKNKLIKYKNWLNEEIIKVNNYVKENKIEGN